MVIKKISLKNVGKLSTFSVNLENETYIVGRNATGKSTILKAILLLSGVSTNTISRIPKLGIKENESVYINCQIGFANEKTPVNLKLSLTKTVSGYKRKYFLNNMETVRSKINPFPAAVLFSPEVITFFSKSPDLRRNMIIDFLKLMNPKFLKLWYKYKTILRNRNKLLKSGYKNKEQIDYWSDRLLKEGLLLMMTLEDFIIQLSDALSELSSKYLIKLYICTKERFQNHLMDGFSRDVRVGYTTVGPHLFDIDLKYNNLSLVDFGSRGETKIGVMLILQAFCKIFYNDYKDYPILLLDDLESELDELGLSTAGDLLKNPNQQKIITILTNKKKLIAPKGDAKIVNIDN